MIRTGLAAIALAALALPAAADTPPPSNAQPLSRIVAAVEANIADLAFIEDVSWDDDGHWEIEYRTTGGREVEIRTGPDDADLPAHLGLFREMLGQDSTARGGILVATINGEAAAGSPWAAVFVAAGFRRTYRGLELRRHLSG